MNEQFWKKVYDKLDHYKGYFYIFDRFWFL